MTWAVGVRTTAARRTARVANTTADLGQLVNAPSCRCVRHPCGGYERQATVSARPWPAILSPRSLAESPEQRMTFKTKILFSIMSSLLFVVPSAATEFTYQEYTKTPEVWKRGFVFGISQYMSAVAQPDEEPPYPVRTAFQRCLASSTDTLLVRQVEAYVAANPASSKGPIVPIIMRAFFNLCRPEIEKAQSPKPVPSQR
jgi:hypothetical protein